MQEVNLLHSDMETKMDAPKSSYYQDIKNKSVWNFALKHGIFRLSGEAVCAVWLILLLRKTELTELEFVVPLILCPIICFLYAMFVWFVKRRSQNSE
jgi:hypothetical protein